MLNKIGYSNILISNTKTINIVAIIKLLRPKQWIKNIFVFLGLLFSKNSIEVSQIISSFISFVLFCSISSSVYILNDIIDIDSDKFHPQKRLRPLPSGSVTKVQALLLLVLIFSTSIIISLIFSSEFAVIILIYFALNILYSIKLKKIFIVDMMVISSGFLLRVIAGNVAIQEEISCWCLMFTIFLTMYLGFTKRKQEILTLNNRAIDHRKTLSEYSIELINQVLPSVSACAIISYSLYTFQGSKDIWMMFTIPMVIYGMIRYQYLTFRSNVGENTEVVFFNDVPFIVNFLALICITITLKNF